MFGKVYKGERWFLWCCGIQIRIWKTGCHRRPDLAFDCKQDGVTIIFLCGLKMKGWDKNYLYFFRGDFMQILGAQLVQKGTLPVAGCTSLKWMKVK